MTAWFSAPLSVVLALSTAAPPGAECGSDLACVAKANAAAARHASPADKASLLFTAARSRLALFRTTGEAAQLCHARRLVVRSAAQPHEHLGDRPAETRREIDAELKRLGHECRQRPKAAPDPGPSTIDPPAQDSTAEPPAPPDAPENDDVAASSAERPASAQEPVPAQEAAPSPADGRLLSARPTAAGNVERDLPPTTTPEGPAPQSASKDSPPPRRPRERVIAGSALAAIGTGLGAGALAGLVGHLRAKATIAEINATLVAEDRAPTTEEIELGIDANHRYKRLGTVALTLAIVGSVSLITGLAVALAPERATSRARIRASGAGLVYSF
jgi:hypothetical protein